MLRLATICVLFLAATGCSTVRFNQKERLADPQMAFDPDPLTNEMAGHVLNPREGSVGGFNGTAGAGGCGCN